MFYFLYRNTFALPCVYGSFPQNSGFSATELTEATQNSLVLMLCYFQGHCRIYAHMDMCVLHVLVRARESSKRLYKSQSSP